MIKMATTNLNKTCHSEYGQLEKVFLHPLIAAFRSQDYIDQHWKSLNYLEAPDFDKGVMEYSDFRKLITEANCEVLELEATGQTGMDAMYCRDASIATDHGMILCNMGKGARTGEPFMHRSIYNSLDIKILGEIVAPGTVEGGDVAWIDELTLFVGHTYRTNLEGIRQLRSLLSPFGITVIDFQMPHHKGPSDVFHLMSVLSPVDKDLAVVYSPFMPIYLRNLLLERGFDLVEVPDEEYESMGCNVLAIAPRKCLLVDGNPITQSRLETAGCEVMAYNGKHMSVMGGGGPTCLTRPLRRRAI
jgi:N-dimethylarginine dimethylaminohydrolase